MTPREREDFRRYRDELDYNPDKMIDNMAPIIYHKNLNMKPESMNLEITKEELLEMASQKAVDQMIESENLLEQVWGKITKRIEQVFAEKLNGRIESFLESEMAKLLSTEICPVDIWGEKTGSPTTIKAQLALRAKEFWETKVDSNGKPSTSYGAISRHEYLFGKTVSDEFAKAVKQDIVNIAGAVKDAVRDSMRNAVDEKLNELFKVKSAKDK